MNAASRSTRPLADYDPVLGPAFKTYSQSHPRAAVLAVTCRGLSAGIAPRTIHRWLTSRDIEKRLDYYTQAKYFRQQIVPKAESKCASVSSQQGRAKTALRVARRMVGCLLTPVDVPGVSADRVAKARVALAVVGLSLLRDVREKGFDTALVSGAWAAVQLGCRAPAARSAMKTCVELGWLREMPDRKGSAARYKFHDLPAVRDAAARDHSYSVAALAQGRPVEDEVAELIALAAHPAVGYHLGGKTWLVAVADRAGIDPVSLGVGVRDVPRLRKEFLRLLMEFTGEDVDEPMAAVFDRAAQSTGAAGRWVAAEEARRVQAATRTEEVKAARRLKTQANGVLDRLLQEAPIPSPDADRAAQVEWADGLRDTLAANDLEEKVRRALAAALRNRLRRAGYTPERVRKVADLVCGLPAPPAAEAAAQPRHEDAA